MPDAFFKSGKVGVVNTTLGGYVSQAPAELITTNAN
jgi:hypothetical protein